jgi:hypothetical protein
MMDMSWLKTLAPTVASALGGPLAGMAVTAIGGALGWDDAKVKGMLDAGQLNAEQLSAVRIAETELKAREVENGFKFAELEVRDRESARNMQVSTKSYTPGALSWVVIVATVVLEGWVLVNGLPSSTNEFVAGRILGTLDMAFGTVLAFWLGTSKSSQVKDATIAAQAAGK